MGSGDNPAGLPNRCNSVSDPDGYVQSISRGINQPSPLATIAISEELESAQSVGKTESRHKKEGTKYHALFSFQLWIIC
jgi:hypothetical protein